MTKRTLHMLRIAMLFLVSALISMGVEHWLVEPPGKPVCHKALFDAVHQWERQSPDRRGMFPNQDGSSMNSLSELQENLGNSLRIFVVNTGMSPGSGRMTPAIWSCCI